MKERVEASIFWQASILISGNNKNKKYQQSGQRRDQSKDRPLSFKLSMIRSFHNILKMRIFVKFTCQNTWQQSKSGLFSQILRGLPCSQTYYHKMADNIAFEGVYPPFYMDFSYFYPTQFQTFPDGLPTQMENLPLCNFYQFWNNTSNIFNRTEASFEKGDESQVAEQTLTCSRSLETFEKPKRSQQPRVRPTKNNQSNISNQAFSFATNESKSRNILQNLLKNKRKVDIFYDYTKCLNSNRKKYMSKQTLLKLCTLTEKSPEIEEMRKQKNFSTLAMQEFASGLRFLILYFLKHKSTSSILTSQKIGSNLKRDHITKGREILIFIEENLTTHIEKTTIESNNQIVKSEC